MATDKHLVSAEIKKQALNGRNDTLPVPYYAQLLLLDQLAGRPMADGFLVSADAAKELVSTSYITFEDEVVQGWWSRRWLEGSREPFVFTDFDATFSDHWVMPEIIRGRTFYVHVMSRDEAIEHFFDRATVLDGELIILDGDNV